MPIERVTAEDVYARLRRNTERIYPKENKGLERISPFAQPCGRAGFTFAPGAKIFATGSCFARNVEKSLRQIGAQVTSSPTTLPVGRGAAAQSSLYNKYTVHSILNELRWALSGAPVDHSQYLIPDAGGRYFDMNVTQARDVTGTLDEMTAFRAAYNASFARAAEADVVILTLGLAECWYDTATGIYLNMAPSKPLLKHHPGRFEFHVLDYNDIYDALCEIEALLGRGRTDPPHMLVTVSPVGLAATFREQDALVANCYSKSVQRAAVEAFVTTHRASYFPSYEYITLSDNRFSWGDQDYRHVRQEAVDRIMADVLKLYDGPSQGQRLLEARGHAIPLLDEGHAEAVAVLVEAYNAEFDPDDSLQWIYARALRKLGRRVDCVEVCRGIARGKGKQARAAMRTAINELKLLKDRDRLAEACAFYAREFPRDAAWVEKFEAVPSKRQKAG